MCSRPLRRPVRLECRDWGWGGVVDDEVRGDGNQVTWGLVDHGRDFGNYSMQNGASQVVLVVKNPPANAGDIRDPGSGRPPGGRHGSPLQCSCLENPHRQRSLRGYNPQGHKEPDTTEAT